MSIDEQLRDVVNSMSEMFMIWQGRDGTLDSAHKIAAHAHNVAVKAEGLEQMASDYLNDAFMSSER